MWKLKAETFMAAMGQVKRCISWPAGHAAPGLLSMSSRQFYTVLSNFIHYAAAVLALEIFPTRGSGGGEAGVVYMQLSGRARRKDARLRSLQRAFARVPCRGMTATLKI
jgi:hypothetical protein